MERVITSTESPEQASVIDPTGARSAGWRRHADRVLQPITLLVLIALLPPLLMARRILQTTQLNYQDYWAAMLRFTNPDGSLHLRGLFTYQNEHPFVVPQIVYFLDAKLLGGTNHELGFFSLLMTLASLALVWLLLPRSWSLLIRGLFLVAASAALFCPSGAWNFVRGMSGTAWLSANVFALLGILLASRGRTMLAVLAAALSLLSYGTGFGAPLALIVVALLRRDKRWRWLLPLGLLLGAAVVYQATASSHQSTSGPHGHDPALLLQTFLTNLATLWDPTSSSFGLLMGAAGLMVALGCGLRCWAARELLPELVPWWGLLAYSLAASALISLARNEAFNGSGAQGRYVSLSGLFWLALAVIAIRTVTAPGELPTRALAIVAAVLVFWGASPHVFGNAVSRSAQQDEAAAGLWFNATDPFVAVVQKPQEQIPRLRGLHAYPFNGHYTVGCGLKPSDSIDLSKVRTLPAAAFPQHGVLDSDTVIGNTRQLKGWLYRIGKPTECALLVDASGRVVGGGTAKSPRSDVAAIATSYPQDAGFEVVTQAGNADAQLVFGFSDGFFRLPATAITPPADGSTPTGR